MVRINEEKLKRIEELINADIASGAIKGGAAGIYRNGEPIYRVNCGMADEARGIKWENDTIIRLYSMTKPIMAATAMILFDRGKLDLDDAVSWYIDGFKDQKVWTEDGLVPVKREVTIRDLLNMTSGLCYPDAGFPAGDAMQKLYSDIFDELQAGKPATTLDYANRIGQQPLAFQPGDSWLYGTSADVLGAVVEKVSGKKLGEFMHDELFEPLGMVDTAFYCPEEKLGRFAEVYIDNKGTLEPCLWQHLGLTYLHRKAPEFESGGAGLVSTMDDYAKFAAMLMYGGRYNGKQILSQNATDFLKMPQLNEQQMKGYNWEQLKGYNYGCLMRQYSNDATWGIAVGGNDYGWDGWLGNHFGNDDWNGYTFLYHIQRCGGLGARPFRMIKQIFYGALEFDNE